jgi:hypothetical protein
MHIALKKYYLEGEGVDVALEQGEKAAFLIVKDCRWFSGGWTL